jgi:hypothetical protein
VERARVLLDVLGRTTSVTLPTAFIVPALQGVKGLETGAK